jgi:hypothetical protein
MKVPVIFQMCPAKRISTALTHHVRISLLVFTLLTGAGCVYEEPPADETYLVDLLTQSRSSLDFFSYDLGSTLMLPYLTEFGKKPLNTNIVTSDTDVTITLPFLPLRPTALALQIQSPEGTEQKIVGRVFFNGHDIGFMGLQESPARKLFTIKAQLWNSDINLIEIHFPGTRNSVIVDNLWVLENDHIPLPELDAGNAFTGYTVFPDSGMWENGIYLCPGSCLEFPVRLPLETAFFRSEVRSDLNSDIEIDLSLKTAKAFGSEKSIQTKAVFIKPEKWLLIKWDVSERSGRFAALSIFNRGSSAILLKNPLITRF